MPCQLYQLPIDVSLTEQLARWLIATQSDADPDPDAAPEALAYSLPSCLVVLPSTRVCAALEHELLAASGAACLLLPQLSTPDRLLLHGASRLQLDTGGLPADDLRALLLARRLAETDWLRKAPETAAGLAEELILLFDEARLREVEIRMLGDDDLESLLTLDLPAAVEILADDLRHLREAWQLYRQVVPRDRCDLLREVIARIEVEGWPGLAPELVVVAGFADLPPLRARLIRAVAADRPLHLFSPAAADPLSQLFLATYRRTDSAVFPLRPAGAVVGTLCGDAAATGSGTDGSEDLNTRLARLPAATALLGTDGPLRLLPCADPEHESRAVARQVVEHLSTTTEHAGGMRVIVATADRDLAARVVAQLLAAGIDVDDTGGKVLAVLPAGILVRAILRAVMSGVLFDQLLEILTHAYVDLQPEEGRHATWALRLERMIRQPRAPVGGLPALVALADDYDAAARRAYQLFDAGMARFVHRIATAVAPLMALRGGGRRPGRDYSAALRAVWAALVPGQDLSSKGDRSRETEDVPALATLLDDLDGALDGALDDAVGDGRQSLSLGEFSAALQRLLRQRVVRAHRSAFLPVQVMGLLEARLESCDLLILAGMSATVFPGRRKRYQLLSDRFRDGLGLATWREGAARSGELFLRLLHNGRQVVLSWPGEARGRPCLPSPLISRLWLTGDSAVDDHAVDDHAVDDHAANDHAADDLAADDPGANERDEDLVYRLQPLPWPRIVAEQAAFAAEDSRVRATAARQPRQLSHSALASYRGCPYRYLLERGYRLKEEERVLREFGARDYGQLAHACLAAFLAPDKPGWRALARGQVGEALDILQAEAAAVFGRQAEGIPQRQLWGLIFGTAAPDLVDFEIVRFGSWRPLAVETSFTLTLAELRAWILREATAQGEDPGDVASLDPALADFPLRGVIDRVDAAVGSEETAPLPAGDEFFVIDYKSGSFVPSAASVISGDELQVILYALAVEAGRVEGVTDWLTARENASAARVVGGAYYGLQTGRLGFRKPQLNLAGSEGRAVLLAGAREVLATVLSATDPEGRFPLIPGFAAQDAQATLPCRHCRLAGICRLEERGVEPHVQVALRRLMTQKRGF